MTEINISGNNPIPNITTNSSSNNDSPSPLIRNGPPPPFDKSRVKLGPGALPQEEFDPLRWEEVDIFWKEVDLRFFPICQEDLTFLKEFASNYFGGEEDSNLRIPEPGAPLDGLHTNNLPRILTQQNDIASYCNTNKATGAEDQKKFENPTDNSQHQLSRQILNSCPYTHRLYAAMIDEGSGSLYKGDANGKSFAVDDTFWIGPSDEEHMRPYQCVLEERVKHELKSCGLIDIEDDDPLQSELRRIQWQLRDTKLANLLRVKLLYTHVVKSEIKKQAFRREVKRHSDKVEMFYLEHMMDRLKKNKKSRSKYQRLYNSLFSRYHEKKKKGRGDEKPTDSSRSRNRSSNKKRRRKLGPMPLPALQFGDLGDDIDQHAETITNIINDLGGEATMDQIATEFLKREKTLDSIEIARTKASWTLNTATFERGNLFRRKGNHRYSLTK